jgi:hypothetical protein
MKRLVLLFALLNGYAAHAQEEEEYKGLEALLNSSSKSGEAILSTFKGSRLINAQTVDLHPVGELQFFIQHRFGTVNSGARQYFGIHNAFTRFGFEYGILENWAVGISSASQEKVADLYQKIKLLSQKESGMPISLTLYSAIFYRGSESFNYVPTGISLQPRHYISYTHQLLLASKINDAFSLQLMPGIYHSNLVPSSSYQNSQFVLGAGLRLKLNKRMSLIADYYFLSDSHSKSEKSEQERQLGIGRLYEPISLGWEIESGGHVFQLVFSNSRGMGDALLLSETRTSWLDGGIHFGFNLQRTFRLKKNQ